MSSFLVIIFQSGRILKISENIQDSCLLFAKKIYLLLKKMPFLQNTPALQHLHSEVVWRSKLKLAIFFLSVPMPRPLLIVGGGGDCGGYFLNIYFFSDKIS